MGNKGKYKVRFNLGRGENYLKWKITNNETKESEYLDCNEVSLTLLNCTLHNNRNRAEEINLGCSKSVCAWVNCEVILIGEPKEIEGDKISYNPRVLPHWVHNKKDVDGEFYPILITNKNMIYDRSV